MKTNRQCRFIVRTLVVQSVLFFNIHTVMAVAFPFREFAEGDPVPDVTLKSFQAGKQTATFSGLKGKPFLAVFWGADLPEKASLRARNLTQQQLTFSKAVNR